MGYSVYFSDKYNRWQGYGVPAYCDHPNCKNEIDRGMGFMCCEHPDHMASCGGFFCEEHKYQYVYHDELEELTDEELQEFGIDSRDEEPCDDDGIICCKHKCIEPKEHPQWIKHISTDESWREWREENLEAFEEMKANQKQS